MANQQPPKRTFICETAPTPKGRTVMEGEDFSAINRLLAQVRVASAAAATASQASQKPVVGTEVKRKNA